MESTKPTLSELATPNHQLSKKLLGALMSYTDLSHAEINNLSEREGWKMVYANKPQNALKHEICFTGFARSIKKELIDLAIKAGFHVADSVTKNLHYLCIGENAGPIKIQTAKDQNTAILTKDEFKEMLQSGQLPI